MSADIAPDSWRCRTPWGRIIAAAIKGGVAMTPDRLSGEISRSLNAAGYTIVHAGDFPENVAPSNVLSLQPVASVVPQVREDVVELLEAALADARAGRLTFVALGGNHVNGETNAAWAGDLNPVRSLAAVTHLRLRFEAAYLAHPANGGAA